jgi:hypothetical protein
MSDQSDTPTTNQPPTPPPLLHAFSTAIEGLPTGDADWNNTVSVATISRLLPGPRPDAAEADPRWWFADRDGERQLVRVDTNYKATRESQYPADLSRAGAVALVVAVLTAIEDTFHLSRVGQLRPAEAAELLRGLTDVDYALTELRAHALEDVLRPEPDDDTNTDTPEKD